MQDFEARSVNGKPFAFGANFGGSTPSRASKLRKKRSYDGSSFNGLGPRALDAQIGVQIPASQPI